MVANNKKRIMITIPKDWDYIIEKAKQYALGSSMTNSYLFMYLILEHLYENKYLSLDQWKTKYDEVFFNDK